MVAVERIGVDQDSSQELFNDPLAFGLGGKMAQALAQLGQLRGVFLVARLL